MSYSPKDLKIWQQSVTNEHAHVPTPPEYEVRGIFDVGYYEYNLSFIVSALSDAQDLYDLSNSVHGLMVMLKDAYEAPAVAKEIARSLGPDYHVVTWMQENANILNALIVEKNVMFYLLFFIMIVAALCILGGLIPAWRAGRLKPVEALRYE